MTSRSDAAPWIAAFGAIAVVITGVITTVLGAPRWLAAVSMAPMLLLACAATWLEWRRPRRD